MTHKTLTFLRCFYFFSELKFYHSIALIYFAHVTGSWMMAASIISITQISAAIFEVPTGVFSDWVGRQRTIVLGASCGVLAVTSYAIGANYGWLAFGAILEGAARACYSGNNSAYLYNILSQTNKIDTYANHFGKLYSLSALAELVSTLMGGFMAARSFNVLMWLSVATQIAGLLVSLLLPKENKTAPSRSTFRLHLLEALDGFRHNPKLRLLSLSVILGNGIGLSAWSLQPAVFNAIWPLWAVGVARAFQAATAMLGGYLSGSIIKRLHARRVILFGSIYAWLANIIPALFPSPVAPLLIASSPILDGPQTTAIETLLQGEFSERQRATMASLSALVGSLFYAGFAFATGAVADIIGPIQTLVVVQLFLLPVLLINWRLARLL
ncbi:MAG: MFS transporter [Anaerolineae bacterium]|nr:MFS transporter [Anaerolineae bacterium]